MYNSIILDLQKTLNTWMVLLLSLSFILSIFILAFPFLMKFLLQSFFSNRVEIKTQDEDGEYFLKARITFLLCLIYLFLGGWAINHYLLPGKFTNISLLSDVGIIVSAVFLGWILIRVRFENTFRIFRKAAVVLVTILIVLNVFTSIYKRISAPDGPNVILIMVDTLRSDHLGCYNYYRNTTPNVDSLSRDSIFFKHAIASASWTVPSVASVVTALYPATLGIKESPIVLENEVLTLAEIFRENNYRTKGINSNTLITKIFGFGQGFDSYDDEDAKDLAYISSPSVTKKAISFIENHGDETFFLFLFYYDPHHTYHLHESYDFFPEYKGPLHSGIPNWKLLEKAPCMSPDDAKYIRAVYDSEIRFTDHHIGLFLKKLKELDLYDDAVIIFAADHGEEFLERGNNYIGHGRTLYQEQIHVPLIVKKENQHRHMIIEEYTGLIDLMPTIVDYAGLSIPEKYSYEGEIIDVDGREERGNRAIISETRRRRNLQSIIFAGWKMIRDQDDNSEELYNLVNDAAELNDIVAENEKMVISMEELLETWKDHMYSEKRKITGSDSIKNKEMIKKLQSLGYL